MVGQKTSKIIFKYCSCKDIFTDTCKHYFSKGLNVYQLKKSLFTTENGKEHTFPVKENNKLKGCQ